MEIKVQLKPMAVRKPHIHQRGLYFIAFPNTHWLPLIQFTNSYDSHLQLVRPPQTTRQLDNRIRHHAQPHPPHACL